MGMRQEIVAPFGHQMAGKVVFLEIYISYSSSLKNVLDSRPFLWYNNFKSSFIFPEAQKVWY